MADVRSILLSQQEFLRRACDTAQGGVPAKVLASKTGLAEATLRSYGKADAPAMMPLSALHALCGAVPAELINLLLPDGFVLVPVPGEIDHAAAAIAAADFMASYAASRHPESEAGEAIGPGEAKALRAKVAAIALRQAQGERA